VGNARAALPPPSPPHPSPRELLPGELASVSGRGHKVWGRCTAVVRSGIPPTDTLFKVRACARVCDRVVGMGLSFGRHLGWMGLG
jgi:hypothetical protein